MLQLKYLVRRKVPVLFVPILLLAGMACTEAQVKTSLESIIQNVDSVEGEVTVVGKDGRTITLDFDAESAFEADDSIAESDGLQPSNFVEKMEVDGSQTSQSRIDGVFGANEDDRDTVKSEEEQVRIPLIDTNLHPEIDFPGAHVDINVLERTKAHFDAAATAAFRVEPQDDEAKAGSPGEDVSDAVDREVGWPEGTFTKAEDEIKRAHVKIEEAIADGKETSAAEQRLEQAHLVLIEARTKLAEGNIVLAEELAEEAADLASQARMKYLGKSLDEIDLTDVFEVDPDGSISGQIQEQDSLSHAVADEVDDDSSSSSSNVASRTESTFAETEEEIERAYIKIDEARAEGLEISAAEQRLEQARHVFLKARTSFAEGLFEMAEELAEEAADLASQARMKYLGKSSDEFNVTVVDDVVPDLDVTGAVADEFDDDYSSGSSDDDNVEEQEDFIFAGFVVGLTPTRLTLEDATALVITDTTRLDGAISEGVEVLVEAVRLPDGTLVATRIRSDVEETGQDEESGS